MRLTAGLVQLNASDDPEGNLPETERMIREAAAAGAELILTPEVTNCVSASRVRQNEVLQVEAEDRTLLRFRELASELGSWLSIGSLALKSGDADDRFVNRSFLIDSAGSIVARYDKIHMFDVSIGGDDAYQESAGYRPGSRAVLAPTPWGPIGLTICYDMRFPALYRDLAQAGAVILFAPSAFTVPTGKSHWETLLRARSIETGSFLLAAAQCGTHAASRGRRRETWGHSLAVGPWGEILADGGVQAGFTTVEMDLTAVAEARQRIPSLTHDRAFGLARI